MFDSKLLEIIRALSRTELDEFIDSPFYNDKRLRKEVVLLFEYIIEDHPVCSRPQLSKEDTHEYLFGEKAYVENRLNHVMTALLRIIEAFLISRYAGLQEETQQMLALTKFYQEKRLHNRFEASIAQLQNALKKVKAENEHSLWQKYKLEYLKHLYSGFYLQRNTDLNLNEALNSLDTYYIAQRLILSAGLLTQQNLIKVDTSQTMLIYELMSKWENLAADMAQKHLIQAYYKLFPLLTLEADLDYVRAYRQFLENSRSAIPGEHLKALYTTIRNYLANQYNSGVSGVLPILFSNLRDEYEQGFLFEPDGKMRASTFQNVVTTALKLKHYDWAKGFIDSVRTMLTGASEPENIIVFNEANYFFHIGDHEAALNTGFHLLKNDNYNYVLASRRLEIKIWYEKQDFDMADYRLNALKSYLFSNKKSIPDQMKRNNDDFVDVFRQLMSPRNRENARRLQSIREKLVNERKNIAEREWFLEKLEPFQ